MQHYNNSDPSNKFLVTLGHHQSDQSKRKLNQSFANFPSENYNCTFSQSSVNPYKLISTTLHDNEFSPSVKLFEPISTNDGVNNNSMKRISQKLISGEHLYIFESNKKTMALIIGQDLNFFQISRVGSK